MNCETIVITRPKSDKDALTELLQRRGHHVIHEPLSHIALKTSAQAMLEQAIEAGPDAVLVTSRHGVQALAALSDLRDLALVCVGEATAKTAESAGFTRIFPAGGTVRQMLEHVVDAYDPGSRLLYVCGEHVRTDLAAALTRQGFPTGRVTVYEAWAARNFSEVFAEQLKRSQIDAVTFLSPRAAQIFTSLATQDKLEDTLARLHAFTLSSDIAETLLPAQWKKIHIAEKPTLASLAASIDNTAS